MDGYGKTAWRSCSIVHLKLAAVLENNIARGAASFSCSARVSACVGARVLPIEWSWRAGVSRRAIRRLQGPVKPGFSEVSTPATLDDGHATNLPTHAFPKCGAAIPAARWINGLLPHSRWQGQGVHSGTLCQYCSLVGGLPGVTGQEGTGVGLDMARLSPSPPLLDKYAAMARHLL